MRKHHEHHYTERIGWLRAAVLGANDGIVSTASLLVGVAAAHADRSEVLIAGIAGLVAGAMSMAAGEYVSVSSQSDTEKADLEREQRELDRNWDLEHRELASIYEGRGLDQDLAHRVAGQLMDHDALGAHARDELGLTDTHSPQPILAALASASSFALGAAVPLVLAGVTPVEHVISAVAAGSLVCLALLGGLAARAGGAPIAAGAWRVIMWGAIAMAVTAGAGTLFGAIV